MNEIENILKLLQAHLKNIKKKIAHIFHFSQNVSKEIAVHSDIAIAKPTKPVYNSHFIEKKRPACNKKIWRPNVNPIKIIINRYQHPIALYLIFFYFISKWPLIHMSCNCECRFVRYEKPLWMQVLQYLATASHSQWYTAHTVCRFFNELLPCNGITAWNWLQKEHITFRKLLL